MSKVRVSLSLDEGLVKEIDSSIDGIFVRSRSDAVEKILKEWLMHKNTAVILAGGNPDKLFIKELGVYRPLVDLKGETLIENTIKKCREAGFVNIIVVGSRPMIGKMYETISDGKKYGVKITYIEEKKELGSAKTLELAKDYIHSDFLFLPCDHYFDFDLRKLYEFHVKQAGVVTLAVHTRRSFEWKKGIVEMDGFKIVGYEEEPKMAKTYLSSIFIGFMKKDVLNLIPPGEVYWSLQENIFPKLAKEGKLFGYPVAGNWVNIHHKEDAEKAINLIEESPMIRS